MKDFIDQTKEVLGVEDTPKERKEDLEKKKAKGDDTDRDRKELHELNKKAEDEPL